MKNLSILIAAVLLLTSVSALELTPEYSSNIIVKDLQNSIKLNLKIENATPGTYNLYTLADISIKPSETFEITTDPFQKEFTISTTDNLDVDGSYAFTYTLNHRGIEKIEQRMLLNIVHLEDILEISSESITPNSTRLSFYIQNKETVHLENITAKFSSLLFETDELTFDLKPNEKFEITVYVNEAKLKKTKAGVYIISSIFQTKNGEREIEGNLYLGEQKGITSTEDKSGILIKSETITKVNTGNIIESVQIDLERNILTRLLTSFNIEPTIIERNGLNIKYTWIKEKLSPTEAYIIKAKTNYILPFLIIVLGIITLIVFKRFSETKLEIKKSVSPVKTKNGEFALKIQLTLKARKDIENTSLIDKVPAIVKIYNKFGNVKPDKIDAKNRRIHWNIGSLSAGEERIFTYIVYSKVGVVGKFSLPRAVAIFEECNTLHEIDSNNVFFMNEQINN